ncbi:histidine phosphatase family protein [Albidovulum sediminicola]|uniref:Histidine phosphatase family protein n=1 Tax=Albidovulum sediminicola TaxID=2984331 RepID=A0ABT2YYI4_9RHOB|nr:histidine phosphatase family protein [Defluviimonas sp. WL0075]MCV2863842.1 histidine phosphatase family protein [Defluviimonas sp. WL0075]
MLACPELFVLRHGETLWNAEGRIQGALDSPLTERGIAQARRQAQILADLGLGPRTHRFYVSPQGRARQTAGIVLSPLGVNPEVDTRLREIAMGAYEGLTRDEIRQRFPGAFDEQDPFLWYDTAPRGEGFAALQARVENFLAGLTGPSVIIAHGMLSRFLRGAVLGLELEGIAALPGGQGVVYHLQDGHHRRLD